MQQREFAKHLRRNMTESENRLWRHLRAHRLNGEKFRRQQPIGPYVVDFVHFGARLIVEADGGQHNGAPCDERRDAWLRSQGFKVMRFWNNEIMGNPEGVLEAVMKAVADSSLSANIPLSPSPSPARGEGSFPARGEGGLSPSPLVGDNWGEGGLSPSPLAGEGRGEGGKTGET